MKRGLTGKWLPQSVQDRDFEAFCPTSLPPSPNLIWDSELVKILSKSIESIARLDGVARLLPDLHLFIYGYIRKEAVLSSQIEGTQSSLSDLLLFENEAVPGVPIDDVTEVLRYVQALELGIKRIQSGERISIRLLLDLHRILLSSGRGTNKDPGQLRSTQNWIGGMTPDRATFVPPPPEKVLECLEKLFQYWENSTDNTLIKAALIHAQFETIHPFRDGNGRVGRLLITLILCQEKLISIPVVYLSLYLKQNRTIYYDKLQSVRLNGDWEDWVEFFLNGITQVTESAFETTKKIHYLFDEDIKRIRKNGGRKAAGMLEVFRVAQISPIFSVPSAEKKMEKIISKPTLYTATTELVKLGILNTLPLDKSGVKFYIYQNYVDLL
jgi:Fic family protein